ncbi:MAG: isopenicillin N synthase family dioxygenase [Hyphomicrobiaceae bacterium]
MSAIPIIDLTKSESTIVAEVDSACAEIGFFVLVNHGVPQAIIDALHALTLEFFDLPLAEKMKVARPSPEVNRGFIASGTETLARINGAGQGVPADYKEVLTIGPFGFPDEPYFTGPAAFPSFYPNLWPARPAGLKEAMIAYWNAMAKVEMRIIRVFERALGLWPGFFDDKLDRRINMMRLIDYPPYHGTPLPGQLRAGVHTDLGMFGMVNQSNDVAGLEVQDRRGNWIAPPIRRDGFICNLGDLLARWTNNRWMSTPHRVANPSPGAGAAARRTSLVYFTTPNYDAVIECLPTCLSAGEVPIFAPITVDGYRRSRFAQTFNPSAGSERVPSMTGSM